MKRYWNLNYLESSCLLVFALSFLAALVPAMENTADGVFRIGFPIFFFTVRASQSLEFSAHFGVMGFLADVVILYAAVCVLCSVWKKRMKEK